MSFSCLNHLCCLVQGFGEVGFKVFGIFWDGNVKSELKKSISARILLLPFWANRVLDSSNCLICACLVFGFVNLNPNSRDLALFSSWAFQSLSLETTWIQESGNSVNWISEFAIKLGSNQRGTEAVCFELNYLRKILLLQLFCQLGNLILKTSSWLHWFLRKLYFD